MGKGNKNPMIRPTAIAARQNQKRQTSSILDVMVDGREFESISGYSVANMNIVAEIRKAISEIETIRGKKLICYCANVVNPSIKTSTSIDFDDNLPFSELVNTLQTEKNDVDVVIITNGGSAQQVDKFVTKLRHRFNNVSFILPSVAMSAGTIFIMSGNEIIMTEDSVFGPIDPQIPNKEGRYVPAQAILTLLNTIQRRGEENIRNHLPPMWSDLEILRNLDHKDIGAAMTASAYCIQLVTNYLTNYKFSTWKNHSDGTSVTFSQKEERASIIAGLLCDHAIWKSHASAINRDVAKNKCKLEIVHAENIKGLDRAIRRFNVLFHWLFENTAIAKVYISDDYCIIRSDKI